MRVIVGMVVLTLVLLLVSVVGTTWRMFFPRPPAPYFVCVYVTEHGSTTVTGSTPCPAPVTGVHGTGLTSGH